MHRILGVVEDHPRERHERFEIGDRIASQSARMAIKRPLMGRVVRGGFGVGLIRGHWRWYSVCIGLSTQ